MFMEICVHAHSIRKCLFAVQICVRTFTPHVCSLCLFVCTDLHHILFASSILSDKLKLKCHKYPQKWKTERLWNFVWKSSKYSGLRENIRHIKAIEVLYRPRNKQDNYLISC